jgi:signal transduction histidine kinase
MIAEGRLDGGSTRPYARCMDVSRPARPARGRTLSWRAVPATVVDLALAVAVFVATADQGTGSEFGLTGELPWGARTLIAAAVALPLLVRRRNPYPLLVAGTAAWVVMSAPWGLMVALYTVSARPRRPRWYLPGVAVLALVVLARLLLPATRSPEMSGSLAVIVAVLVVGVPVLLGLWVGARRALIESLRERAERLQAQQHLEAERAKAQERARIAREMHDVVAHRVSLMVLHAGALEVARLDPEAARQAGLIRRTGREALEELRHILGVLRQQGDGAPLDPQPTLADLDGLVQRSRGAGMKIALVVEGERRALPATVERTAYRLVQEALTNAHKHAAGAAAEVRLRYGPERLELTVRNARPPDGRAAGPALPGGGHGLLGLRERVELLGGTFDAARRLDGGFELRAAVPVEGPA